MPFWISPYEMPSGVVAFGPLNRSSLPDVNFALEQFQYGSARERITPTSDGAKGSFIGALTVRLSFA